MKHFISTNGLYRHCGAILFIAIISISFYSCFPGTMIPDPYYVSTDRQEKNIYYASAATRVAMLEKKGSGSFAMKYAGSGLHSSGQLEGAYNATRHIGGNVIYGGGDNNGDQETKFHQFEAGAYYYTSFHKKFNLEIAAGGGAGTFKNIHHTGFSTLKIKKYYIQPAIGVHNADNTFLFAFVTKIEGANFRLATNTIDKDREQITAAQFTSLHDHPFHISLQPGMIMRFGWNGFRFETAYSYNADLTVPGLQRARHSLSAGINVPFRIFSRSDRLKW